MKWNETVLLSTQSRLVFTGCVSRSPSSCNSSDFARQSFCSSIQILQACQCLGKIISPFLFHLIRQTKKSSHKERHRKTVYSSTKSLAFRVWDQSLSLYHQVASGSVPGSLIIHTAVLVQAEHQPFCQGDGLQALISSSRYQLWYLIWMTKCWPGWIYIKSGHTLALFSTPGGITHLCPLCTFYHRAFLADFLLATHFRNVSACEYWSNRFHKSCLCGGSMDMLEILPLAKLDTSFDVGCGLWHNPGGKGEERQEREKRREVGWPQATKF